MLDYLCYYLVIVYDAFSRFGTPAGNVQPCLVTSAFQRPEKIKEQSKDLPPLPKQIKTNQNKMSAIGSLVFCTDCGNLLENSAGNKDAILGCDCCGAENRDTAASKILTTTKPSAFPSLLRQKRSAIQTIKQSDRQSDAVIQETCPECGRKEVRYSQAQLRGADEGTTIFYNCECGHKFVPYSNVKFMS